MFLRVFVESFKGVSMVFQGSFKGVSRVFQEGFKKVLFYNLVVASHALAPSKLEGLFYFVHFLYTFIETAC